MIPASRLRVSSGALLALSRLALLAVFAHLFRGRHAGQAGRCGMLKLHCPNSQAARILVWHTTVVPVSAGFGKPLEDQRSFDTFFGALRQT
jgi:tryptophanyl-tRNA synthetase